MDLDELQKIVAAGPRTGTIVLRKDFQQVQKEGKYRKCTFSLGTNYRCLDAYSDKQRVVHEGFCGTIWTGPMRSESFTLTCQDNLAKVLEDAYRRSQAKCDHDYGRELSTKECREKGIYHGGNCYHVYECPKCKEFFSVDSSG